MGKTNKKAVGIFLIGGFLLFAIGLFMIGDRRKLFSDNIDLYTEFHNLSGLQPGSQVRVAGIMAGEVLSIQVPPDPESKFRVRFRIVDELAEIVRQNSMATIQSDGIVGNKFMQVDAGTSQFPRVQDNDVIPSREPFEFGDLLDEARGIFLAANSAVEEVRGDVREVVSNVNEVADEAQRLVIGIRPGIERFVTASREVMDGVNDIVVGVKQGEGSIGKLFTDDEFYEQAKVSMRRFDDITQDISESAGNLNALIADAKETDIVGNLDKTVENVRDMTASAKEMVAGFGGEDGDGGLMADVRQTMIYARSTMSSFSENAEALKRNFLFKGFFENRGFYSLDDIPVAEYREGTAAPGYPVDRAWLHSNDMFTTDATGDEVLTREGRRHIDKQIAPLMPGLRDRAVIIEGYAMGDDESEEFLVSQRRGNAVRNYLIEHFMLRPSHVGVMPMGRVASRDEGYWEGVSVVTFMSEREMRQILRERERREKEEKKNSKSD
jgi:phospholipid/cholesterol/gamma-HCH transport system substrate-binding protein